MIWKSMYMYVIYNPLPDDLNKIKVHIDKMNKMAQMVIF